MSTVNNLEVSSPANRNLVPSPFHDRHAVPKVEFSVGQYNILGRCYCIEEWFANCQKKNLDWENRRIALKNEVLSLDADILCFQELDEYPYFKEVLEPVGYSGYFLQRPGKNDGCSIFYRAKKFELLKSHHLNFSDTTQRVALFLQLKLLSGVNNTPDITLCVGTTHLYWDSRQASLQEKQVHQILDALKSFNSAGLPTVITGDFNSKPRTGVYKLMEKSGFVSSYDNYKLTGKEPPFTCKDMYTIDYIWSLSSDHCKLVPKEVLEIPSTSLVYHQGGIPNEILPSDHISLKTVFAVHTK